MLRKLAAMNEAAGTKTRGSKSRRGPVGARAEKRPPKAQAWVVGRISPEG
jgi:hypothetical protein